MVVDTPQKKHKDLKKQLTILMRLFLTRNLTEKEKMPSNGIKT
jgi:hypothetical protein